MKSEYLEQQQKKNNECMCVSFKKKKFYYFFIFKETKYIDEGRCICMSVCMYLDLNWFPGKEKINK